MLDKNLFRRILNGRPVQTSEVVQMSDRQLERVRASLSNLVGLDNVRQYNYVVCEMNRRDLIARGVIKG